MPSSPGTISSRFLDSCTSPRSSSTSRAGSGCGATFTTGPPRQSVSVQEEIVNAIISEGVRLALSDAELLAIGRHPTDDAVAYDLYLQARHLAFRGTEADVRKAIDLLVRATGRDPRFAQAYKLLAESYVSLGLDGFARPTEAFPEANRNISRAFEIELQLAEAHATAAAVAFFFDWDWAAAEREMDARRQPAERRVTHAGTREPFHGALGPGRSSRGASDRADASSPGPVDGVVCRARGRLPALLRSTRGRRGALPEDHR